MPKLFVTTLQKKEELNVPVTANAPKQDVEEISNPHIGSDRCIPSRAHSFPRNTDLQEVLSAKSEGSFDGEPSIYTQNLSLALFGRTLSQLQRASARDVNRVFPAPKRKSRTPYQINSGLCRNLPDYGDDDSANVLCRTEHTVYVAIAELVYSFTPSTRTTNRLNDETDENEDPLTNQVNALGCNANWLLSSVHNNLQIFDANTGKLATTIRETGDFNTIINDASSGFYLCSKAGGFIAHYDIRSTRVTQLGMHPSIISIAFNALDKKTLAASFMEGSAVKLFDIRRTTNSNHNLIDTANLSHNACSNVIAFSPFVSNRLLTAGGVNDHSLNLWNTASRKLVAKGVNGAQLTSAHWLDEESLFVTEGYMSNRVSTWAIKDEIIEKESKCKGDATSHQRRVLLSAQHPIDRGDIVTAGADDSLRFWSVRKPASNLDDADNTEHQSKRSRSGLNSLTLR